MNIIIIRLKAGRSEFNRNRIELQKRWISMINFEDITNYCSGWSCTELDE